MFGGRIQTHESVQLVLKPPCIRLLFGHIGSPHCAFFDFAITQPREYCYEVRKAYSVVFLKTQGRVHYRVELAKKFSLFHYMYRNIGPLASVLIVLH